MKSLAWIAVLGLCLAFAAQARGLVPQKEGTLPQVGAPAPELTGSGDAAHLKDHKGSSLIVYFASSATRDSKIALNALAEELKRVGPLEGAKLLIVLPDGSDATDLKDPIATLPLETHIVISSDRKDMQTYGVIAYPTAFVLDTQHEVAAIIRGYGTLSSFRTIEAVRFTTGAITREQYLQEIGATQGAPKAKPDRYVIMAEKLIGEGRTRLALDTLLGHLDDSSDLRHVVLTARLAVLLEDEPSTVTALERLTKFESAAHEIALLGIERYIRAGKLDAARSALDGLITAHSARTTYLEGLLAKAAGDTEASAERFQESAEAFATLTEVR